MFHIHRVVWRPEDLELCRQSDAFLLEEILPSCDPLTETVLQGYLKLSTHFSWTPSMVMFGWQRIVFGAAWTRSFVFPRLMVSSKNLDASAKWSTMVCRWFSLCAMTAQSSANMASMMSFSAVWVWVESRRRSKAEPSERYLTYSPSSRPFTVRSRTCEKNKLNKTGRLRSLVSRHWRYWRSWCSHHCREHDRSCCRRRALPVWWTCVGSPA